MDRYSKYSRLKFDRPHPHVLRVTITTDTKHNLMDPEMHHELGQIWRDVDDDPTVSAAILTAAGVSFSAGGNIKRQKDGVDFEDRARTMKEAHNIVYNMINCTKPIVSALEGPAVGAGLAAGLLADIVVAGRSARIIDGHTRLGVAAGDHAAIIWPLLCGMAKAKYHLLLCETVTGEEAERIGLVSLCADDDKVIDTAMTVCDRLLAGPQVAIRWTKHALNNWLRMAGPTFDTSLALEFIGFSGPEVREGRRALIEKRQPNFPPDCPF